MDALACVLHGKKVSWVRELDSDAWEQLYQCAVKHSILPLVTDAVPPDVMNAEVSEPAAVFIARSRREILRQAAKTGEMCLLYRHLRSKGLFPLVMKGIVCRALYPDPEHRSSVDEDLLVKPAVFQKMHEVLLDYGLTPDVSDQDAAEHFEISYRDDSRRIYIEVHKTPFTPDSPLLDRLNDCFLGAYDRAISQRICGTDFLTLGLEDHLLYLLLHALKHFLYSGFGIRQICDIGLFSEAHYHEIDWDSLRVQLEKVEAMDFARAVFRVAGEYLLPGNHMGEYLADWDLDGIDAEPLLADVMEGGLYGASTMSRLHSSNMTLQAASSQSSHGTRAVLYSLFPPLEAMKSKFPYLKKMPMLLPFAWLQRQLSYLWELIRHRGRSNSALTSIRVGSERIRLLEQYNIIKR